MKSTEETEVPADLREALAEVPAAESAWGNLTAIGRRDYIGWINGAKQAETRARRITRCHESLLDGKKRPCCYAVVPMDLYKVLGANPEAKTQWSALTANEKRDFSDWIEDSPDRETRKSRVRDACIIIASGKRLP